MGNITIRLRPVVPSLRVKFAIAPSTPTLDAAVTAAQAAQAAAELAETHAETAETNAETAETNAAASAAAALTSENNAETAETNAETAETNAAASAAAALVSENNAATSETNAATSESNAAASESAAAASAAEAEAAADNFDDVYLGSKASDPTLDNDGNALVEGQLYWNSVSNSLKIYDGVAWNAYSAATGLTAVVDDTAPTLGGNLDTNGFTVGGRNIATDGTKLDGIESSADVTDAVNIASSIHGVSGKTTPVDADEFGGIDSADSNALKKFTWANIKATLDTLYQPLAAKLTAIAALTWAADKVMYFTGTGAVATTDLPAYGRTLIGQTSEANLKAAINAEAGVDFQAYDAQLSSLLTITNKNSSYTIALTESAKTVRLNGGSGQTLTIPANASVALPVGMAVTILNRSGNSWSLAITTDQLVWLPTGATGTRTIANNAECTIIKEDTTSWVVSGVGLT